MNATQYSSLLATITVLEARFQSYLSDTPTNVVQGNRGALKSAMTETLNAFANIDAPEDVDYAEVVKNALASLAPKQEASKTLGDNAITSGEGGFNQDGSPIEAEKIEEIEKTETVETVETNEVDESDEVTDLPTDDENDEVQ